MKNRKTNFFGISIIVALLAFTAIFGLGGIQGAKDMRFGIDIRGGVEAIFHPVGLDREPTQEELTAARTVIETRLDSKNILDREVTIEKENGNIIVRFPWKSTEKEFNPEAAIKELGATAKLTFRDVDGNILVDGKYVSDSTSEEVTNQTTGLSDGYSVQLKFNSQGTAEFADVTEKMIGQLLCIYMDDTEIFRATVSTAITDGNAEISGLTTAEEATALSDQINAGALPFSMETSNYSSISPSLGNGALTTMVRAGMIAFTIVCLFMILYYRLPGVVSCITLIFQIACQLLLLSIPQFTLTLPGIAGIILSVGMAVDANIIIAERISEEMKAGNSIMSSIKSGYKNAFSSVFDGNLTTGIVAAILMIFGSGTMLSFGYTLLMGVILNLVVVFLSKKMLTSLILFNALKNSKFFRQKKDVKIIPFFKNRFIIFGITAGMLVVGVIIICVNGIKLDTSFAGGAMLKYNYSGEVNIDEFETLASNQFDRPVSIQTTTDFASGGNKMILTLAGNEGITPDQQESLLASLMKENPNANLKLSESYIVEPYIGAQALQDSIIAIVVASLFIIIYVWFRFKNISGLSAGVMALFALVHDMLIVLFIFALFRIPLNDAFTAVILTIIGYSINDTIVLYDRIRDNKHKLAKPTAAELVDVSTSQIMSRSINTVLTTTVCVLTILIFSWVYGIESIRVFALPMLFGLISGCYSSVCLAGPLWASWQKH